MLVGDAAEVREKPAHVRERLHLTDLAGNFALGSLPDLQTRATLRRFMKRWRRSIEFGDFFIRGRLPLIFLYRE